MIPICPPSCPHFSQCPQPQGTGEGLPVEKNDWNPTQPVQSRVTSPSDRPRRPSPACRVRTWLSRRQQSVLLLIYSNGLLCRAQRFPGLLLPIDFGSTGSCLAADCQLPTVGGIRRAFPRAAHTQGTCQVKSNIRDSVCMGRFTHSAASLALLRDLLQSGAGDRSSVIRSFKPLGESGDSHAGRQEASGCTVWLGRWLPGQEVLAVICSRSSPG